MIPDRISILGRAIIVVVFSTATVLGTIALQRRYLPDRVDASSDILKANKLLDELPPDGVLDEQPAASSPKSPDSSLSQGSTAAARDSALGSNFDFHVQPAAARENDGGAGTTVRILDAPPAVERTTAGATSGSDASQAPAESGLDSLSSNQPRALAAGSEPGRLFPPPGSSVRPAQSAAGSSGAPQNALAAIEPLELMRQLRDEDGEQQKGARDELLRRGFNQVDLELSRQLLDPDVEVRKRLAVTVPRLASVDAVPWLLWLSQDPEPSVRYVALSTLGTTGDPALLQRVEQLARNDRDPQVQSLAKQIARQHEAATRRGEMR